MKLISVLLAATVLAVAPAQASNFSGVRAEVTAGVDDVTRSFDATDITYGAAIGVDAPIAPNVIAGVEASVDNVFDRRDIAASARLGYVVAPAVLVYGKAGYANYKDAFSRKLDGLRVGGGLEVNISGNSYVKAEYRYTDFEQGVGKHAGLVGVGVRF